MIILYRGILMNAKSCLFAVLLVFSFCNLVFAETTPKKSNPHINNETTIFISGSTTVYPIAKAFSNHYKEIYPNIKFEITANGSGDGAKALINSQCDIANMSRFMKPKEFQMAIDNGVFPVFHTVSMDAILLIVHPDNPVNGLTTEQIKEVYTGKITNWKELGGLDAMITVLSRDSKSGTRKVFNKMILRGGVEKSGKTLVRNGDIQKYVSENRNAIGYVGLAFTDGVKPILVDGISPLIDNIATGKYPLGRPLFMVTNGYPSLGSHVQQYINFHAKPDGKKAVEEAGYVSLQGYGEVTIGDVFEKYWHYFALFLAVFFGFASIKTHTHNQAIKKEQKKIASLRNYLSNIIDSMPSAIIGINKDSAIEQWNNHAKEIFQVPAEDVIGKDIGNIIQLQSEIISSIKVHLQNREIATENQIAYRIGDKNLYLDMVFYPLSQSDNHGAVIRVDDVTKKVELEKTLQQSRKMEAVGQLAGGIAHDFKNMLGAILTSAQLFKYRQKKDNPNLKYINIIESASQQANDLISKLLDFSRKGANMESIDVNIALEKSIELLKHSLDKRIVIKLDLAIDSAIINGDLSQLQNIFLNMGINASHAMVDGGSLIFSLNNVYLNKEFCESSNYDIAPGQYIRIGIADTGSGIPEDIIDEIFNPFFTTKDDGKGTGLGLASVKAIVEQHGGAVDVISKIDVGTTFYLYFPKGKQQPQLNKRNYEEWIYGTGNILFVDDEILIRDTTVSVLEELGYSAIVAVDGQDALDKFRKYAPALDLIIFDLMMPNLSGKEFFEIIKNERPDMKTVVATGFSDHESIQYMLDNGLNAHLPKPYSVEKLGSVIHQIFSSS
ncbi:MAG: phosphate ABC transporter substrate-binding protein PstS family protein [Gammaproteobacteria bacterium]|nr:MAG: phosphate ABC transporter substrate-binding protein PstS family protein [Gammaproteobacteria bacterium]